MDTPEKDQIGTSIFKFEDSPVFNYINSLSPIKPVKSNTAQIFTPLSFASPQSVFASPHTGSHKESRFLRRHHFSDLSKPGCSHIRNEDCSNERSPDVVQLSDLCSERLGRIIPERSSGSCTREPPYEKLKLAIESPKNLKYDSGSPESDAVHCDAVDTEMADPPAALVQDILSERCHPFESEVDLREICQTEQNKGTPGSNWESLISIATNLLISDESIMEKQSEGQDQNTIDSRELAFISTILEIPQDDMNDLHKAQSVSSVCSAQHETDEPVTQPGSQEMKETHRTQEVLSSTLLCRLVGNDPSAEVDDNGGNCIQSNCKHSIRRRCLVFETVGAHRKQSPCTPNSSSMLLSRSNCEIATNGKQLVLFKPRNGYLTTSILPGIGLHLNSLAATSNNGKVVNHETHPSGKRPISMPSSSFNCSASVEKLQDKSLTLKSMERDFVPNENDIQVKDDASITSMLGAGEEFNRSSPKRKRQRLEHDGGSEACKRCNCKKSKCLKLYCECFAAGLYCVDPCSCQDCFNKPVHEDTVLETRRLIESRNPLAFAPKVIRKTDSVPDYGDDSSNKTPASARHKRGCNCKKSSCLKKYCECFQGGVGCSISCRCEGCKNSFGRKDGVDVIEIEGEDAESREMIELELSSKNNAVHKVEEGHPDVAIPSPSSEIGRASLQLPFSFCGKSLQFSALAVRSALQLSPSQILEKRLQVIPEEDTPEILTDNSLPASCVKSISPSSKRVSPPHGKLGSSALRSRKLILRSIPSFPSLTSQQVTSDLPAKEH